MTTSTPGTAGTDDAPSIVIVVGNPRPASRTWHAAHRLTREMFGSTPSAAFDLAHFGPELLRPDAPDVQAAVDAVRAASVVVVASPTYKATYTGLLKLFLERFDRHGLAGIRAVPLMLAALPEHALAGEYQLKPVLAEIGLSCPTSACFLLDSDVDAPGAFDAWLATARRAWSAPH